MEKSTAKKLPVVLCIMDGWGHGEDSETNAIHRADADYVFDPLFITNTVDTAYPKCLLLASGPAVGLPEGQVGNSEVGHMTIGAGRIILPGLSRLDTAVADGSIAQMPKLDAFANRLIDSGGTAHLMGLVSPGGVHSRDEHIMALAHALNTKGVKVALHAFTDGRDTLPQLAAKSLPEFIARLPQNTTLATVIGRYYAMDRDNRWQRTQGAWNAITHGRGDYHASTASDAIAKAYKQGFWSDEVLPPVVIGDYQGMEDGDAILMANFRADRVRQLLAGFCGAQCGFDTADLPRLNRGLGLMPYSRVLDKKIDILFDAPHIANTLGAVVADNGLRQYRLAETEKYAHVSFFFNGGSEDKFIGETRELIASPLVSTYAEAPQMNAEAVGDALVKAIASKDYDLIIVNFANPDIVGHTGDLRSTIEAVRAVDQEIKKATQALHKAGGVMLLTADHGNCEVMWDTAARSPHTAHSYNPVPCWLIGAEAGYRLTDGTLADLAPTLLALLGLEIPFDMTGRSLLLKK